MPPEVAIECAKHPNIVGMKESGGDVTKIGMIMSATKNNHLNFCVLAGATTFLLPSSQVGSNGAVCGLGNMIPDECCKLQELIGNRCTCNVKPLNLFIFVKTIMNFNKIRQLNLSF